MDKEVRFFLQQLIWPTILAFGILCATWYNLKYDGFLTRYGIYPRSLDGIKGIITSPFVHSSWKHFFSNIVPLISTMVLIQSFYTKVSRFVLVIGYFATGILVWMFGGSSYHIGASGVVYAYIAFLFWSGVFRKDTKSIVLSLLVLVVYGGFFDGLKPQEGVSWESHLLGFIVGMVLGFVLKNINKEVVVEAPKMQTIRNRFLPTDAFQFTKQERAFMAWQAEQERLRIEAMRQNEGL